MRTTGPTRPLRQVHVCQQCGVAVFRAWSPRPPWYTPDVYDFWSSPSRLHLCRALWGEGS